MGNCFRKKTQKPYNPDLIFIESETNLIDNKKAKKDKKKEKKKDATDSKISFLILS